MISASASRDHALVRSFAKKSHSNFYYSFLFLPAAQRDAIEAVYAFCRSVDDAVDSAGDPESAAAQLEWWRTELASCFGTGEPSHHISRDLAVQVPRFQLTREPLEEVINGVEMDLTRHSYRSFEDLSLYCRRVASAVGLSCIEIFGSRGEQSRQYATTLGMAFQMTNIIRDFRVDSRSGRLYIPEEELQLFGYSMDEAAAGTITPEFISLMKFQVNRAQNLFKKAASELPAQDRGKLVAAEIMSAIYRRILSKIASRPEAVLGERVSISRTRKMAIAATAYARTRFHA